MLSRETVYIVETYEQTDGVPLVHDHMYAIFVEWTDYN